MLRPLLWFSSLLYQGTLLLLFDFIDPLKRPLRKGRPYFSSEGALLVPDVCVMVDDNINAIGWKQRTKPNIDVPSFDEVLERIQIDIEQDKREASEWIKTAQLEHASIGR